ncbi:MAG: hypothetical protein ACI9E1_000721 [Cryomorphaceae bacterium]|jgi:hypothetical protein
MFKAILTARSPLSYINLEEIAKKTKLGFRKSKKFSPEGILDSLIKCVIKGKGSFRDIASTLAPVEKKPMSRQGIPLRENEKCVTFLSQTAYALIALQAKPAEKICSKFGMKRILTEDSTFQRMNPRNAGN